MKNSTYIILLLGIAISAATCKKDFLNRNNPETISSSDLWSDASLVQLYINNIYNDLPGWDYNTYNNIADEARSNYPGGPNSIILGDWNDTNNPMDIWAGTYGAIRKCNEFFKNIQTADIDSSIKTREIGEVKFLRAFFYFRLVKRYGGVPLITEAQSLSDSLLIPRNSADECFTFIIDELDAAAERLPAEADKGRATKGAALAIKGRALLFYASPLFNPDHQAQRWKEAAEACRAVMDLHVYSLYPDLKKLWLDPSNSESIFEVEYHMPEKYHGLDAKVKPLIIANGDAGQCSPLQELVDAFPMKNGKLITDPGSGYDPEHPYEGRDDRFYADIAYNGAQVSGTNGGPLKTITLRVFRGGRDYDSVPSNTVFNTLTGYFCVKAIDPGNTNYHYGYGSTQPWIEIRYAEVLLNYAEAQNEAEGPDAGVYAALNEIRQRAGITAALPAGLNQDEMRKVIRQERYVELCFENKRYWDLRRWKLATAYLNDMKYHGVIITKEADGHFTYDYQPFDPQPMKFEEKMYLMPIPHSEILKDPHLKQNPGWPQ
ncbi:RagB/SusD family nutrient uptake outer membrane protein [Compostibacter hankyongensis]|uniref:RagB/SusD family nutrient uptake outer membrane protein n=1 Tax=Compostibacter hankyongensis TaxID=1007089 RepID=A0ABP8FLZ5_9BACT